MFGSIEKQQRRMMERAQQALREAEEQGAQARLVEERRAAIEASVAGIAFDFSVPGLTAVEAAFLRSTLDSNTFLYIRAGAERLLDRRVDKYEAVQVVGTLEGIGLIRDTFLDAYAVTPLGCRLLALADPVARFAPAQSS